MWSIPSSSRRASNAVLPPRIAVYWTSCPVRISLGAPHSETHSSSRARDAAVVGPSVTTAPGTNLEWSSRYAVSQAPPSSCFQSVCHIELEWSLSNLTYACFLLGRGRGSFRSRRRTIAYTLPSATRRSSASIARTIFLGPQPHEDRITEASRTTSSRPVTGLVPGLRPLFRSVSSLPSSAQRTHRSTLDFGSPRSLAIRWNDQPSPRRATTHFRRVSRGSSSGYHSGIRGYLRHRT